MKLPCSVETDSVASAGALSETITPLGVMAAPAVLGPDIFLVALLLGGGLADGMAPRLPAHSAAQLVPLAEAIALDAEDLPLVELDPPVPRLHLAVADPQQEADGDDVGVERATSPIFVLRRHRGDAKHSQHHEAGGETSKNSHAFTPEGKGV